MRLITRKIWRAFPELDRFDNEQCRRFVNAANSRLRWRLLRWVLVTAAVILGVLLPYIAFAVEWKLVDWGWINRPVLRPLLTGGRWQNTLWGLGIVLVALFALGAMCGLVTRDLLLRLRVRSVLRIRGVCFLCHYPLVGLPVEPSLHVACPECGHRTQVDASLGELAIGLDGRGRFAPSNAVIHQGDPKRLMRLTVKTANWCAAVLLMVTIGSGAALGLYEWDLRRQAARALALPTGLSQITALMEKTRTGLPPGQGVNGFDLLADLQQAYADAEKRAWPEGRPTLTQTGWRLPELDASYIYFLPSDPTDVEGVAQHATARAQAVEMIAQMERSGVFAQMRELTRAPVRDVSIEAPADAPLFTAPMPQMGQLRRASWWCGGRIVLAAERNDAAALGESLETGLGLARMAEASPWLVGRLTSVGIEMSMIERARAVLQQRPGAELVEAIDKAARAAPPPAPVWIACEAERVAVNDFMRWAFSDPSRTRWGRYNMQLRKQLGGHQPGVLDGRLGTLEENLHGVNKAMDAVVARSRAPRPVRSAPAAAPRTGLALLDQFTGAWIETYFSAIDQVEIDRVGLLLMTALERHRLARGDYPASLAALVPEFVKVLPGDPWSGKPFGYKVLDPSKDAQGRAYLLYTVGADGKDDGGVRATGGGHPLRGVQFTPCDYILNDDGR